MARLKQKIGISSRASVNLPPVSTEGARAGVLLGNAVQSFAAKKAEEDRIKEATLAAQALNFERDPEGRIVAPKLPENKGLLAPSIFDEAYTQQVLRRYTQQIELDAKKQLSDIALQHRLDPTGFEESSQAYIDKVSDTVLPNVQGDARTVMESVQVTLYNNIARLRAEDDHRKAAATHEEYMNDRLVELRSMLATPLTDETVLTSVALAAEIGELAAEGVQFGFMDPFMMENAGEKIQQQATMAILMGDVSRANTIVERANMVEFLNQLSEGKGKIKTIKDGRLMELPVSEVFGDPELRQALVDVPIKMLKAANESAKYSKDAEDNAQFQGFQEWYYSAQMEYLMGGDPVDRNRLYQFGQEAKRTKNHAMMAFVASALKQLDEGSGSMTQFERSVNEYEQIAQKKWQDLLNESLAAWSKDLGFEVTALDQLTEEQVQSTLTEMFRRMPFGNFDQTAESAEWANTLYDNAAQIEIDYGRDGTDLGDIKAVIDTVGQQYGLISRRLASYVTGTLEDTSADKDDIARALTIAGFLNNHPQLRAKFNSQHGFGSNVGRAIQHLLRRSPNRVTPEYVRATLDNFNKPGFAPFADWQNLSPEDREFYNKEFDAGLSERFNNVIFGPQGVNVRDMNPFRKDITAMPADLEQEIYFDLMVRAPYMSKDAEDFDMHLEDSIYNVVQNNGWAPSAIGYSQQRFRDTETGVMDNRPAYSWVKFAPESFYGRQNEQYIIDKVQKRLDAINNVRPGPRLVAGQNASLMYMPEISHMSGKPTWMLMTHYTDGTPLEVPGSENPFSQDVYMTFDELDKFEWPKATGANRRQTLIEGMQVMP